MASAVDCPVCGAHLALGAAMGKGVALMRPEEEASLLGRFGLTPQQAKCGDLAVRGLRSKEIAARLNLVSEQTVKSHLQGVYKKTGARNRTQLATVAVFGRRALLRSEGEPGGKG